MSSKTNREALREPQRTTVTLDADVLERTREFSRTKGLSFRKSLNELVRLGLLVEARPASPESFRIHPRSMGLLAGLSYDNIEELLEIGEGAQHR